MLTSRSLNEMSSLSNKPILLEAAKSTEVASLRNSIILKVLEIGFSATIGSVVVYSLFAPVSSDQTINPDQTIIVPDLLDPDLGPGDSSNQTLFAPIALACTISLIFLVVLTSCLPRRRNQSAKNLNDPSFEPNVKLITPPASQSSGSMDSNTLSRDAIPADVSMGDIFGAGLVEQAWRADLERAKALELEQAKALEQSSRRFKCSWFGSKK